MQKSQSHSRDCRLCHVNIIKVGVSSVSMSTGGVHTAPRGYSPKNKKPRGKNPHCSIYQRLEILGDLLIHTNSL